MPREDVLTNAVADIVRGHDVDVVLARFDRSDVGASESTAVKSLIACAHKISTLETVVFRWALGEMLAHAADFFIGGLMWVPSSPDGSPFPCLHLADPGDIRLAGTLSTEEADVLSKLDRIFLTSLFHMWMRIEDFGKTGERVVDGLEELLDSYEVYFNDVYLDTSDGLPGRYRKPYLGDPEVGPANPGPFAWPNRDEGPFERLQLTYTEAALAVIDMMKIIGDTLARTPLWRDEGTAGERFRAEVITPDGVTRLALLCVDSLQDRAALGRTTKDRALVRELDDIVLALFLDGGNWKSQWTGGRSVLNGKSEQPKNRCGGVRGLPVEDEFDNRLLFFFNDRLRASDLPQLDPRSLSLTELMFYCGVLSDHHCLIWKQIELAHPEVAANKPSLEWKQNQYDDLGVLLATGM